jgi:hypothetical protein
MSPLGLGKDNVPHFGQNIGIPKEPNTLMYANYSNLNDYLLLKAKITISHVLSKF